MSSRNTQFMTEIYSRRHFEPIFSFTMTLTTVTTVSLEFNVVDYRLYYKYRYLKRTDLILLELRLVFTIVYYVNNYITVLSFG